MCIIKSDVGSHCISRQLAPVSLFSLYAKLMVSYGYIQESVINLLS